MSKRCYYEVLEVERTVGETELKTAFRKKAMQYHPDRNQGDKDSEHRFKEINEAYEVLKDKDKRAAYDRYGHAAFEQGAGGGAQGFGGDFASSFPGTKSCHQLIGLVFGVLALAFSFSGFTSMQPWGWLESGPAAGEPAGRYTGKPITSA